MRTVCTDLLERGLSSFKLTEKAQLLALMLRFRDGDPMLRFVFALLVFNLFLLASQASAASNFDSVADSEICLGALGVDARTWSHDASKFKFLSEAKRRGFSVEVCRNVLRTNDEQRGLKTERSLDANIDSLDAGTICKWALSLDRQAWETQGKFQGFVQETKRRGLTLESCRQALEPSIAGQSKESQQMSFLDTVTLCSKALSNDRSQWANGTQYSSYVTEAKHRKLTVGNCAYLAQIVVLSDLSDERICKGALSQDKRSWEKGTLFASVVAEAKRRGKTVDSCRKELGLYNIADDEEVEAGVGVLCYKALNSNKSDWDSRSIYSAYVKAAIERGLSIESCNDILKKVAAASPDPVLIPKPRPKPIEILLMAAANMEIEPASRPPPTQHWTIAGTTLEATEVSHDNLIERSAKGDLIIDRSGKGSLGLHAENVESLSDRNLCLKALDDSRFAWNMTPASATVRAEISRRDLSIFQCRKFLVSTNEILVRDFSKLSDSELCSFALDRTHTAWDMDPTKSFGRQEAQRRGLSILACQDLHGYGNATASAVSPAIADQLPPVVGITSPGEGAEFSDPNVTLRYKLRSPSGLPVEGVSVLIDGRPARGLEPLEAGSIKDKDTEFTGEVSVTLPSRDVEVGLIARSGTISSEVAKVRLIWRGAAASGEDLLKPKLYALIVGVSKYDRPELELGYAAKDASDFAASIQAQEGGLYGAVETRVLVDKQATGDAVLEGLSWLEKQVTSRDVGVFFIAGHGKTDEKNRYYFLPSDVDPAKLKSTAVGRDQIRDSLSSIAGKVLAFLDTCHSAAAGRGDVDTTAIINELAGTDSGTVVFASSTGREISQENADWGNGAFTKALLQGLKGEADLVKDGKITTSELDAYVAETVKTLTSGGQHPVMIRPSTIPDFPITIVR